MSDRDFNSDEGGYLKVMNELADKLMTYRLSGTEWQVMWMFLRFCYGYNNSTCQLTWNDMMEFTQLNRGSLSKAINKLKQKNILKSFQREGKSHVTYKINSKISTWKHTVSKRQQFPKGNRIVSKRHADSCQKETTPIKNNIKTKNNNSHPDELDNHCPHEKIKQLYHNILPELPKIEIWTQTRRSHLKSRWTQKHKTKTGRISNTIEFWEGLFTYIRGSKFLMGESPGRNGGPPFKATLDWIIKSENFAKIVEGKYH